VSISTFSEWVGTSKVPKGKNDFGPLTQHLNWPFLYKYVRIPSLTGKNSFEFEQKRKLFPGDIICVT